jgi:hypothetical protein
MGAQSIMGGRPAADFSQYYRARAAIGANGNVDDPQLQTAMLANGGVGETPVGQGRALANQSDIAAAQTAERAREFNQTPTIVQGPQGPVYSTQGSAPGQAPPMTIDRIKAAAVAHALGLDPNTAAPVQGAPQSQPAAAPQGQPPAAAPSAPTAPQNAPAAPTAAPTSFPGEIPNHPPAPNPLVQQALGLPQGGQVYVNPTTRQVGVSYNGGHTVQDTQTGKWYTGAGNGFLPSDGSAGAAMTQDNNVRNAAGTPLNVPTDMSNSPAANDARATTGLGPAIADEANKHLGAIPGATTVLKAATGSGEIAPQQQQAEQQQMIRNQQTRAVLAASGGRQSVQAQKWVNENLPDGPAFGNPETEARRVATVVGAIKMDYESDQRVAQDPNTPPAERQKALQHMHDLQRIAVMWTGQPQGAPPAATAQPHSAAPATKVLNGKTYFQQNGQWFEQ